MKVNKVYFIALACIITLMASCNRDDVDNPNLTGADITLSSQAEVNAFTGGEDIRILTITGEDITDLSSLPLITVKNLIIENTGIDNLHIPLLESITVSIQLKNNTKLEAIDGLNNLKFFSGDFFIKDNDVLTDISGILGLKTFYGTLTIIGNALLGENVVPLPSDEFGFGPIKKLILDGIIPGSTSVTLIDNHPDAVKDASLIGTPVGVTIVDYILKSKADIQNFVNFDPDLIVRNLTITGSDIDDATLNSLIGKISRVQGVFTFDNTGCRNTFRPDNGGFFGTVKLDSTIIVTNNAVMDNINSFQPIQGVIKGDLILENNPLLDFGWGDDKPDVGSGAGFQNLTEIKGSLIVKNCAKFIDRAFPNVMRIGGDFIIEKGPDGSRTLWNFGRFNMTHVGGDIIVRNNPKVNSLLGFEKLTHVGGDKITIVDNGDLQVGKSDGDKPGLCWVRDAYDNDVIKNKNVRITLKDPNGNSVDFATLAKCF